MGGGAPSGGGNGPNSQRVPLDMPAIIPKNTPARSAGSRPIRRAVMLSPKSRRNSSLGASSIALCRTDGKLGSLAVLSIMGAAMTQAIAMRASPMMASSSVLTKGGIQYSRFKNGAGTYHADFAEAYAESVTPRRTHPVRDKYHHAGIEKLFHLLEKLAEVTRACDRTHATPQSPTWASI